VMVVDETTGKLVGEVSGINGAHGTAVVDKVGRGFATSGEDSSIVMFDLKTFRQLGRIHAAEDADAIIYDPASNRVFSFNGDANSSTVVDPDAGKLVTNIPLGGKPEYGVSAGDGKIYINLTDKAEIVEVDAKTLNVSRRWPTTGCKNPVAMAIDTQHQRLFSGCRSGVMAVSDYRAGKVVAPSFSTLASNAPRTPTSRSVVVRWTSFPFAWSKTLERIGSVVRVLTTFWTCCKPSSSFSLVALNFMSETES